MKIYDSNIERMRDPFVLVEDGVMYAYGTDWVCSKNVIGKLDGGWEEPVSVVDLPENHDIVTDKLSPDYSCWAPEVYKYNGEYYMFTTYRQKSRKTRGCTIFKAESPMGPFKPYSDGIITPEEWDCIDGTLYFEDGKPYMVFVHEWISTPDKIGRFAYARLSDDLKEIISEPVEMFRADDFSWTDYFVTDGCFMYQTKSEELLMLWSNFVSEQDGYAVALAKSDNGKLCGKWIHEKMLFTRVLSGKFDGGHGMIFEFEGKKYLSLHSPNSQNDGRKEKPVFVELREENDTLVAED